MFKTLLQGLSTCPKSLIMFLLSLSVLIGFPLNRESTSEFSSLPIKLEMQRLLNYTHLISFHTTFPAEISALQFRNSSAKPHITWKTYDARSFSCAAPLLWNSISYDIRNSSTIATFRWKLKTWRLLV